MPDMSKVAPWDHDNMWTPLERAKRADMKIRKEMYGFYRVPGGPVKAPRCVKCRSICYSGGTIINGRLLCKECF